MQRYKINVIWDKIERSFLLYILICVNSRSNIGNLHSSCRHKMSVEQKKWWDVKTQVAHPGDALPLKWLRGCGFEEVAILLAAEAGAVLVDAFEFTVTLDLGIGIGGLERVE